MSIGEEKAKRRWWRPRFSVRALAMLVTLVALYFGAWEATKELAIRDIVLKQLQYRELDKDEVREISEDVIRDLRDDPSTSSPMPFVVRTPGLIDPNGKVTYDYYLWFFGACTKDPIWSF